MKSNSTITKALRNLFILFGMFAFSVQVNGQSIEAPKFVKSEIVQNAGEYLKLELKNLPDLSKYPNSDIQINWIIGNCHNGPIYSIRKKVNESSYTFITDYKLSARDNDQQISITVSYINTKGDKQILIPAQRNCIPINIRK